MKAIQESGGQAASVQGDLTNVAHARRLFDTAADIYRGAGIAVNTTGMVLRKPILETTEEDYDRTARPPCVGARRPARNVRRY